MSTLSHQDKRFYIVLLITLAIMLGMGFLPPIGQITPDGMRVLGIFIGCIFAWVFGEVVWSSILGIVLLTLFGYGTMAENFTSAYSNPNVSLLISSLVFCYAIEKSGLLGEISRWIVGMKWAQKSPWMLVLAFYIAALVVAALVVNFILATILLWSVFYELAKEIKVKPFETYSNIVLCGITVAACMGQSLVPYSSIPTTTRSLAMQFDEAFVFNTANYLMLTILLAVISLPLIMLVLRLCFGKKVSQIVIPKKDPYKMILNTESKVSLSLLIIIIVLLIVPNFLPADNAIRVMCNNNLSSTGMFMIGAIILMLIHVKGKPVLDIAEGLANLPWPLFLLCSAALCISDYMTADEMGVVPTIVSLLNPLIEGKSAFAVTMIFVAIGLIMTNFINDFATLMILFPIAAEFVLDAGGSIMVLAIMISQATVQGCLMPSGSMVGAMLHGNSTWLKPKQIFITVGIIECVVLVALMIVTLIGRTLGI